MFDIIYIAPCIQLPSYELFLILTFQLGDNFLDHHCILECDCNDKQIDFGVHFIWTVSLTATVHILWLKPPNNSFPQNLDFTSAVISPKCIFPASYWSTN